MSADDPWLLLKRFTDARIGLGRAGSGMPTREVLSFSMAHAQARDAVKTPIDWTTIEEELAALGLETLRIASAAPDRDTYLRRPDLGRRLSAESRQALAALPPAEADLLIIIGDGLSSTAVTANAVPAIAALLPHVRKNEWRLGPVLLATQARVALCDDAGEFVKARAAVMLIGERPGLSSPDSLGAYLTWEPRVGRKDGERNCISNIRVGGLSADEAAFKIAWLLREAFRRRLTGVNLKDESNYQLEASKPPRSLASP
ncbi:ethanolamine ammonia-lyase subunit EutC [Hyphomicrobium sp.]|uniref:ethanolamine ammonia-lyase subunit EutC n=1 Tax=Hyphomicrobium sp. TaxID=82 RepID=UPI0025C3A7BD|nr:ethanolamine ammonia-lyase subunit EutC [Hyphomicrobium sp.]MCC7253240.1 ethanolamine ammonia-lyase subunit EutC [Hyphomicrobium sp.]